MNPFVPGLDLAEGFFAVHVQPILAGAFPQLRYSAALIGSGSEVLGFDTPMSADHHWGPRAMLFLEPADLDALSARIREQLAQRLPASYRGYSTHFTDPDPVDNGVQRLAQHDGGPINHRVELDSLAGFFQTYLGLSVEQDALTMADWLSLPSQKLRSIVAGRVFRDDLGLQAIRRRFAWYPSDVARYLLGCLWTRIGQEEHLMGRAAHAGDELGSGLIASRLIRDLMRIAFCLRREYPPYPKWFGTAFARLVDVAELKAQLEAAQLAARFPERETALCSAYELVTSMQRTAGVPLGGDGRTSLFWGRPFRVINAEKIAAAVFATITDPQLAELARTRPIGSIDLVSDNTDALEDAELRARVRSLYTI
jgi:hypothetical protein